MKHDAVEEKSRKIGFNEKVRNERFLRFNLKRDS